MFDIFIDGVIGMDFFGDGITAKTVRRDLESVAKAEPVRLRINSPGGDVFEASAIQSVLSDHDGQINVQVDGLAASAASWLAMLGETIVMTDGSMMMIHDPWTILAGNASEFRKEADLLDRLAGEMAIAYGKRIDGGTDQARAAMQAESWYTPDEAVAAGLADEVSREIVAADLAVPESFHFRRVPKKVAISRVSPGKPESHHDTAERLAARAATMRAAIVLTKTRAVA